MSWDFGIITGVGPTEPITVKFNADIESKGVGVELNYDGGVADIQLERLRPNPYTGAYQPVGTAFTTDTQQVASETIQETQYRLNCTNFTSGPIEWILGHSD